MTSPAATAASGRCDSTSYSTPTARTDATDRPPIAQALISVVLPLYNECAVIDQLIAQLQSALAPLNCRYELIFVNDGSSDGSGTKLDEAARRFSQVRVLHLSRNFGHQPAVQAGLLHARGDAVILMDSDLQDDPRSLVQMVQQWQNGHDVVYAIRYGRKENVLKRCAFYGFYRVLNAISNTPIPMDAGNFGLMDRRVAQQVARLADYDRYFPGLRSWVGFRQIGIPVERLARHDDKPRVSTRQLFGLAKTAIFGFSRTPLSLFYLISLVASAVCLLCTGWTLYHKLITGAAIPGWTSIAILVSFFGAVNALGISVLGEYVVRIYDQVRGRPQFVVSRRVNFAAEPADDPASWNLLEQVRQLQQQLQEQLATTNTLQSLEGSLRESDPHDRSAATCTAIPS
jgi:dolichol-phosphate mannosyltransferase